MTAPGGNRIHTNNAESQGTFSTVAPVAGRYTYCFSNERGSGRKTLS